MARHRSPIGSSLSDQNRFGLPPESRSAADAEPRLQSLVLLPVLQRCPDKQATDENGGEADEQDKNDRGGAVHVCKSFPPSGISSPPKLPPVSFPLLGVGRSVWGAKTRFRCTFGANGPSTAGAPSLTFIYRRRLQRRLGDRPHMRYEHLDLRPGNGSRIVCDETVAGTHCEPRCLHHQRNRASPKACLCRCRCWRCAAQFAVTGRAVGQSLTVAQCAAEPRGHLKAGSRSLNCRGPSRPRCNCTPRPATILRCR